MNEFFDVQTEISNNVCSQQVLDAIQRRVKLHHELYETLTLKDKYWEYTLSNAFKDANIKCKWDAESHDAGKDIVLESATYKRISCKSGMVTFSKRRNKISKLKISSYRTTSLKTLEDKLNYIDGNHEDIVYSLSSSLFKTHKKYVLTIFIPPKFKDLSWIQVGNNYKSHKTNGVCASILSQCSDQLWYELDYDSPLILGKYDIFV
jgi:hypothetical protein